MSNNKEFSRLKNSLAIKAVGKIILYTLGCGILLKLVIDGIYNDKIANDVSDYSRQLYYFFVVNKSNIMLFIYSIIFIINSFFVIRSMNNNLVDLIHETDKILKEPEKKVKLSSNLILLENKLNNIRADLVASKTQAKEEQQKKNDLIMYMAHDLKTPLTSVIGYLTLLNDEKDIPRNLQEKYINIALDKSLRLEDLTNQFFEITRYNLKDMQIVKQKLDLSFLLDQLVEECYPMLQERNLSIDINKPNHIYFLGDGDKLARAFGNLLKNAINYSYENSKIELNITQSETGIHMSFKNKGDKIPEHKLQRLFDKFYRADESRRSSTGGTGLGLAITKEIIELHGGVISVKNDDEYIEFYVEL
ncbi:MAG: GHKL domain-containing protein [Clostridia bacterium]|nr:GHKL domain-containing protein [Clostridia bacterium]